MRTRIRISIAFLLTIVALIGVIAWHGGVRARPAASMPLGIAPAANGSVQQPRLQAYQAQHVRPRPDATQEVRLRFEQAVVMLHAKQYEHAITALRRVLELAPSLPEAQVNMGFALLGLGRFDEARRFFDAAIALRTRQANAYYGLALAAEGSRDLPGALGAMRSYLHLSRADDPYRTRARSAIWEWEQALGRGELAHWSPIEPPGASRP